MTKTKQGQIFTLALLGLLIFWVIFLLLRTSDKENYATTLLQFSKSQGIRSHFLFLPFADLGLAFGSNFPLLGYFDLTPLPLLSAIFSLNVAWFIYVSFLVVSSNYIVIKSLLRVTSSKTEAFLAACLLTTLSPVWMDSNLYNDWPATWSASAFCGIAWVTLFASLYSKALSRFDSLIMAFCSVNIFANDPGYFPIYIVGVFCIMGGFSVRDLRYFCRHLWQNIKCDPPVYVLLLFYFSVVSSELFHLGSEFGTRLRSFSDSLILTELKNPFAAPILAYHPRGIGVYFPLLIILVGGWLKKSWSSKTKSRYVLASFFTFLAACVPVGKLISYFGLNPDIFFFYPTGGFFLRDVTVFLLVIVTLLDSRVRKGNFVTPHQTKVILSIAIAYQLSFSVFLGSSPKSDLMPIFSSHKPLVKDSFFLDRYYNQSSGIAFTSEAIENSRSVTNPYFWMSTDFQQKGDRLLTASTKLQSKDFFNMSNSTFQASTISGDAAFWCREDTIRNYWVDYVVMSKSEVGAGQCNNNSIRDLGNLRIYRLNHSGNSDHQINARVFRNGELFTSFGLPVLVKSDGRKLALEIIKSPEKNPTGTIKVTLPIEYSSNLRARVGKEFVVIKKGERGFSEVDVWNSGKTLFVYYEATLTQKIRIISTYSSLGFLVFYVVSFRHKLARKSKNLKKVQDSAL